ncbi:RNA polymerase sigma factor [Nocardioides speluncae]|uniref:RNA polymerase sigma factor n=1 Tax=Nocardioides speluncae TaxID=2670337 RepID=UPI000D68D2CB|nr:sigma-70 family RNA polymerase sigma factor [Nocardioides speluncae]
MADQLEQVDPGELVRAAQRGDTVALCDVLDLVTPYVGRVCGAIALDSGPDAAQETLMVVMRSLGGLREPAALFGWVRAIAVREAVRYAERDRRAWPLEEHTLARLPAPGDPELISDVHDVLTRLTPRLRAVLLLRDVHGYSEEDAAALLDLPVGTVKSRLHRARESFRKAWQS